MAGVAPDLEKQARTATHPDHSTVTSTPALEKTPSTHRQTLTNSLTRLPSHSSTNTDPLAPLEHALGQPLSRADIEPTPPDDDDPDDEDDEDDRPNLAALHLTRTRTSITSAASRPPDFEVTLDVDGPENPRNWYVLTPFPPPFLFLCPTARDCKS